MTQRDRWAKRAPVLRYYTYCDELRRLYPYDLPPELRLIFYLPMPKTWSKKKRAKYNGKPHQVKPDTDNLTKAVKDALAKNDSYIYSEYATKYWAEEPSIFIAPLNQE